MTRKSTAFLWSTIKLILISSFFYENFFRCRREKCLGREVRFRRLRVREKRRKKTNFHRPEKLIGQKDQALEKMANHHRPSEDLRMVRILSQIWFRFHYKKASFQHFYKISDFKSFLLSSFFFFIFLNFKIDEL